MPMIDAVPVAVLAKGLRTDTATTDFAVTVPYTGKGYTVRRVTVYNSRILATDATADNSSATLSVRGGAGATGKSIVADAALTTHTTNLIVSDRTVAATGVTPIVTESTIYIRVGTASGVAGSAIDVVIVVEPLP